MDTKPKPIQIKFVNNKEQKELFDRVVAGDDVANEAIKMFLSDIYVRILDGIEANESQFEGLAVDSIKIPFTIQYELTINKYVPNKDVIKRDFETIKDDRGYIKKIAQNVDVLNIFSKKGSRRAAHYHRSSSHLSCLNSGKMFYFERPANSNVKPLKIIISPGDYFFTGARQEHLMVFLEDSEFDCYSFGSRDKEDYEKDLVRIDWDLQDIYDNWKD